MTSKVPLRYVVAAMHRLAEQYARSQGWERDTYKTVTEGRSLKGLSVSVEIFYVDTKMRFTDSSVITLLRQRFTNVRTVHLS